MDFKVTPPYESVSLCMKQSKCMQNVLSRSSVFQHVEICLIVLGISPIQILLEYFSMIYVKCIHIGMLAVFHFCFLYNQQHSSTFLWKHEILIAIHQLYLNPLGILLW